jgi:uncharacterized protein
MLAEEIKRRMFAAMKAKNTVEKEILRVALGEIQMAEVRGEAATDETAIAAVKKLVKSNQESLALTSDPESADVLKQEIEILKAILPQGLSIEQIIGALGEVEEAIKSAKAEGPATGIAMKHLKSQALAVDGKDVKAAVVRLRGG